MKIGIYGGSFDPIHWGHLLLAETCLRECKLDRIVFVPTGVAPHKPNRAFAPAEDRIEMVNLALSGCDEFCTSRFEIDSHAERNYTIDTLRHFNETFCGPELYLILGADMLNDLPNWHKAEEICELAIPVVAARPNTPLPDYGALSSVVSPKRLELFRNYLVPMPLIELSSTQIRKLLAEGKRIRFQTPHAVETYIATHRLYQ
ncbi:MAG: nicotinate-nucleotide adenylyltransferase [Planctomycetaceae bacterium]|nr:nicotinate-nucleotide adenylyltransferase [Planctomycetaceae bacterium]